MDRKGNPDHEPLQVPKPFGSVLGNLTPDMLGELRDAKGRSDGFSERVVFAFPEPRPRRYWSDEGLPAEVGEEWATVVRTLRAFPMAIGQDGGSIPQVIHLTPEAEAAWVAAYNAHVDDLNSPKSSPADVASEGKLAEFAGRMVLILHVLRMATRPGGMRPGPIPPVDQTTVEGAMRLRDYFRCQLRRVQAVMAGKGLIGMPHGARLILIGVTQ